MAVCKPISLYRQVFCHNRAVLMIRDNRSGFDQMFVSPGSLSVTHRNFLCLDASRRFLLHSATFPMHEKATFRHCSAQNFEAGVGLIDYHSG